ncbi:Listeria/Bacterioides repeat-containing protein, partial [Anaerosphaera aminiphila DSM 21120]
MKKRIISLLLVFTFIFSTIPSFAAENNELAPDVKSTGKVTVNYLDMSGFPLTYEDNKKSFESVELTGDIGTTYATQGLYPKYKNIPDVMNREYFFNCSDGATTGVFTDTEQVVNYYYLKIEGFVQVKHMGNINGKEYEISPPTNYMNYIGNQYEISPKEIPDWTPIDSETITGTYDESFPKVITIKYEFNPVYKNDENSSVIVLLNSPTVNDDPMYPGGTKKSIVVKGTKGEIGQVRYDKYILNGDTPKVNINTPSWTKESENLRSEVLSGTFKNDIDIIKIDYTLSTPQYNSNAVYIDKYTKDEVSKYKVSDIPTNMDNKVGLPYEISPIINENDKYDYKDTDGRIYIFNSISKEGSLPTGILEYDLNKESPVDIIFLYDRVFTITYNGNKDATGTPPDDKKSPYSRDGEATVMDKGDLVNGELEFKEWNTKADGTGTTYSPDGKIEFNEALIKEIDASDNKEGITLYAIWEAPTPGSVLVNKVDAETGKGLEGATFKLDKEIEASEEKDDVVLDDKSKEIAEIEAELEQKTTELNTLATPLEENGEKIATESTNEEPKSLEKSSEEKAFEQQPKSPEKASEENTTGQEPIGQEPDIEQQIEKLKEEIKELEVKLELLNSKEENDSTENNPIENDPVEEFPKELTTGTDGKVTIENLEDGTYTLKEIVAPEGYILEEDKEYTIKVVNGTVTINDEADVKEITITNKKIVPTEEYRVTYDGNTNDSGTVPVDTNNPYAKDSEVTVLPKGNLSKTGYTFKGWNTKIDGSGTSYKVGDTFKITANTTLYAIWQKDSEDSGTGWTWSGDSSTASKESPKTEEVLTHMAYLNGYPDNTIRPQGSITRAEVATIFSRLKVGEANIPSGTTNYSDVNPSDWYSKYIAFVTDNNIMEGYEDGSFKPNDKITRAEFTAVVARYNSLSDTTSTFEDVIGHWAAGYIGSVTNKGWINGYPDGTFKPEKDISREEVATMVNKML